ncbi:MULTISPECIES: iron-containing redox enzyme family protein [unclassified Legionella]|uniref:iron-containing redox enzyme family protein n=1 Tax=unclassified Legionella TaxID=2622702 RepID=UPI001055E64D|nr:MULTISPECIES: iron-containing redox enzyme family protein [unclassified Legionella]MDI9819837.1 iron-containing redox enzyme family protein [Legionella sp. PL877]
MSSVSSIEMPFAFEEFLSMTDAGYRHQLAQIALFDKKTIFWDEERKKKFAAIFYHLRGHFINFMWYLANFSPDPYTKKIVMENIHEELGTESRFSHEMLYERFANECGVDIKDEIVNETNYLPFARQFNKEHLRWLTEHDADERLSAFAAYERLDNIDYPYLLEFAESLSLSPSATAFFRVHVHVEHFESTVEKLVPIWHESEEKVKKSFAFIYNHQINMWRQLSDITFSSD